MRRTTFFMLCLEGAILSFNVAAASALVPSIAKDFAVSQFLTGKIIWLYMFPYGISALLYGPLVRLFDAKVIELLCLFLFSSANLMAGLSQNIFSLFVARFFMGIFGASVIPLALILIGRYITQDRGKYVGLFFGITFVASLVGLFLSGIIWWRLIFIIPAIFGFILCIHIYFYLPSFSRPISKLSSGIPPPAEKKDTGNFKINYLNAFKNKTVASLFIYIFLISLFYHGIQQWLAVYFSNRYQFSQFFISMLITLTSLAGICGEVFGGWLSDKIGRLRTVDSGIVLMILSAFLLMFKAPPVILVLIMIIWGLGWTFNHAGLSVILTDLPKEFLNEAASLNSSVRFISGGIGAVLGGALMQRNFSLWIAFFGICLLGLLVLNKKERIWAQIYKVRRQ